MLYIFSIFTLPFPPYNHFNMKGGLIPLNLALPCLASPSPALPCHAEPRLEYEWAKMPNNKLFNFYILNLW